MTQLYLLDKGQYDNIPDAIIDGAFSEFYIANDWGADYRSIAFLDAMDDANFVVRACSDKLTGDELQLEVYMKHPVTGEYVTCSSLNAWAVDGCKGL